MAGISVGEVLGIVLTVVVVALIVLDVIRGPSDHDNDGCPM